MITRPAPVQPPEVTEVKPADTVKPQIVHKENTQEEEFTPPPMSKQISENDILVLWDKLVNNVKSPATKALLNLATPVKISPEEVIITFKNEKLVSQISTNNKKDMLVKAANVLFGQDETKVTIRLPQPGDEKLAVLSQASALKNKSDSSALKKNETSQEKIESQSELIANQANVENTDVEQTENVNFSKQETDQEKMVLELFDGKFVE